jgi:hypothetical protein
MPGMRIAIEALAAASLARLRRLHADAAGLPADRRAGAGRMHDDRARIEEPGYDVNATPAPPLHDVIESAGLGC